MSNAARQMPRTSEVDETLTTGMELLIVPVFEIGRTGFQSELNVPVSEWIVNLWF